MKVLIFDTTNAFLTPGGKTTHALKLQKEIAKLGVDIQFARWWDKEQSDCDIIHFLTPSPDIAKLAKKQGKKTFLSLIFDYESNKREVEKITTILKNRFIDHLPGVLSSNAYWHAFQYFDKVQFMHKYDKINAIRYFPRLLKDEKTIIIPHAYDPEDINISSDLDINAKNLPKKYLISCANISIRKQTIKLAKYAKKAKIPVVFIGSHLQNDEYFNLFEKLIDNVYVFYLGYVSKEWKDCIESHASGFVLLSLGESGCISVYEAASYKLPLLLSNLPWAWGYEDPVDISFCDQDDENKSVIQLKKFYMKASKMDHTPFLIHTWNEVAKMYVKEYENLLYK